MENEYNDNVIKLGDRIHEAFAYEGEKPNKVEYKVAEVLDGLGVTDFKPNGDISDPKIEFEKDGQKKVLSFSAISDEEFALISGMDGYNENDLIRIEDKVKTYRM